MNDFNASIVAVPIANKSTVKLPVSENSNVGSQRLMMVTTSSIISAANETETID